MYAKRPKIDKSSTHLCMNFGCDMHVPDEYSMRLTRITCKPMPCAPSPCGGIRGLLDNPCLSLVVDPAPEPEGVTFSLIEKREDGNVCAVLTKRDLESLESGIYRAELLRDGVPVPGACFEVEVCHMAARPRSAFVESRTPCIEDCSVECETEEAESGDSESRPLWGEE